MSDDKDELRRLWNARREQERKIARDIAEKHVAEQREQAARDAKMDKAFEDDLTRYLGLDSYEDVQRTMRAALNDPDSEISKVADKYIKATKKGKKHAAKVIKQNKAAAKKAAKKHGKKKGCLSALVVLAGTAVTLASAAVWGAVEIVAAITR